MLGILPVIFLLSWNGDVSAATELAVQLRSITAAGMLGLFALCALTKSAITKGAFAGILAGELFSGCATFTSIDLLVLGRVVLDLGLLNFQLYSFLIWVLTHLLVFVVGLEANLWLSAMWQGEVHSLGLTKATVNKD